MTDQQPKHITIVISKPFLLHLAVGLTLLAAAAALFIASLNDHRYADTAAGAGQLLGCAVLAYWLWCDYQRGRRDLAAVFACASAGVEEASLREVRTKAVLEELGSEVRENRDAIKELSDLVAELLGAVEALQDCYMAEGTALVLPVIEPPPDQA